jgi:2-methylisocitrate lyase-like PEP mutase family enzyme
MDRFEKPILTSVPVEGTKGTGLSAVFGARRQAFRALGVRRISVGPALARAAWTGFMRAAQALKSDGSFAGFAGLASYADINDFLAADLSTRQTRGV